MYTYVHISIHTYTYVYTRVSIHAHNMCVYVYIYIHRYIHIHMYTRIYLCRCICVDVCISIYICTHGSASKYGFVAFPPLCYNLCRGPSVTNPCRGPLCRVLQSSTGLSQGGFAARPPDSVTSLVAKRPPSPMFLRHCRIVTYIYIYTFSTHTCAHTYASLNK